MIVTSIHYTTPQLKTIMCRSSNNIIAEWNAWITLYHSENIVGYDKWY